MTTKPEHPAALRTAHLHTAAEVAARLRVNPDEGLAADEVNTRRDQHGLNALDDAAPRSWASRLLSPFKDFMIVVLLAAALLSGVMGDVTDTLVILLIVVLNAAIAVTQEWQADRAIDALRQMSAAKATVRRAGSHDCIATEHLVPGDVVLLEAGNLVPADLRLHEVAQLRVDESALTGESITVEKHTHHLPEGEHPLGDRLNMAYKGTLVTHGRATGLVVATGHDTELGQVASLLQQAPDRSTPLQQRLAAFGKRLSVVVLAICAVVFAIGVIRGESVLLMALTAISLAVAAIPEALPAVVTVLLALGARRLVKVHALVRRLPSVETLGSVTTICSDKTGTLTLNRMTVQSVHASAGQDAALLTTAVLCNDARAEGASWVGDPTETALLAAAARQGLDVHDLIRQQPRQHEWPFDADRKRMSTLHAHAKGWRLCTKGAPEMVLPRCTSQAGIQGPEPMDQARWLAQAQSLAAQGLRVLALARREGQGPVEACSADQIEQELQLLGLIGLIDPPRPEATAAVAECLSAGIRPVMITGDHPATALAIAGQLGIVAPGAVEGAPRAQALTGAELAGMDDDALRTAVSRISVFARMDPTQKIRIVQALQAQGEFVAMTGDGVNDAPALKAADIGVAMGLGGTDVAREAASLVLLDDNFATIVGAVREGRRIFDNIRKFIRYAMTGNSGEIWVL
ncbi:MAG TPA: HAD-IC family P-type ATPase, partial [Aquabacterium sp.]|uniref:cation-translocating P-type ATPase n=1 Tax=Aquabacterium sp. TaxID=1872578 RepID=UPI002E367B00